MQGTRLRTLAAAAGVAAIALTGAAGTAQAQVQKSFNYTCLYPYLDNAQPLAANIVGQIPDSWPAGKLTDPFTLTAAATAGGETPSAIGLISASTIEGVANAKVVLAPTGQAPLNLSVNLSIAKQAVSSSAPFTLNANGSTPRITVNGVGPATIDVGALKLTLIARYSDGTVAEIPNLDQKYSPLDSNPDTFEVGCSLAAGQSTRFTTVNFTGGTTATPTPTVVKTPTPTATPVKTPTPTVVKTPTPTATPVKTPTPTVVKTPTPTPVKTPVKTPTPTPVKTPTPTPTSGGSVIKYAYSLSGSATLKSLTTGSLPLTGSINAELAASTGKFTADLALNPTKGSLKSLGFLPVDATVVLVPTEKVTGTLQSGKLNATAKVRIKIPSAKTFGIELAGGSNCQTQQISTIPLQSTQPEFRPLQGGPLAGTFSISDLQDCGFLTGLVSTLTKGSGNTIALNLTPKSAS